MANSLGHSLIITSFGESHGKETGVIIDGFPPGFLIDRELIKKDLRRRRPGQSDITSPRNESDEFEIISGLHKEQSTGAPICIIIPNTSQKPGDYDALKDIYRPGHADNVYDVKYGIWDHRGGGRSSARLTAAWVAAGALAKQYLSDACGIEIQSVVSRIGNEKAENVYALDWSKAETNKVRCPEPETATRIEALIKQASEEGDSLGGIISTRIKGCPAGLGEPLFDKLNADLAKAIFSINAVKGLEFGSGFAGTEKKGSENNDQAGTERNNDGGINGGISNGREIIFNIAFKPVSSISKEQKAYNKAGEIVALKVEGRHDPCVLPRAVPIVEAMSALTLADHFLMNLKYKK